MFDTRKFIRVIDFKVSDVIKLLKTYPQDAQFTVIGDNQFYIHQEEDGSTVTFDTESMLEEYNEDEVEKLPDDYDKSLTPSQVWKKLNIEED